MAYATPWDRARVRQVLTTESRQKARELFLRTHRPFRRIRVDLCKEADLTGRFISEEEVYALIADGELRADNRLFFVVGEAGSGKSELCQWLEYRTEPKRRLPIHVPRSMTSAAHVAALLRRALGMAGASALRYAPIATQARLVALTAAVLLYERPDPALTPAPVWENLLNSVPFQRAIEEHLEAAAQGMYQHRLLPEPNPALAPPELPPDTLIAAWPAVRRLATHALEQTLWLGDLRSILAEIADTALAGDVRPLLLLEDITAFRTLGDRLLDYLLDLSSGHFDAVIGITTGFERTQLATATLEGDLTHVHQRLRARLVLSDSHGRNYGLDEDVVDLTRSYLTAIREGSNGAVTVAGEEAFGAGLYPFSATLLQRAFAALHEQGSPRQTPRLFLEHVLGAALLTNEPPPAALDRSSHIQPPPVLFRADDVTDPQLQSVLRWYGHVDENFVALDPQIPAALGIAVPPELLCDGVIRVARTYVSPHVDAPTPAGADWQQELRELQAWLAHGGLYPSRETLKRGIEQLLLMLGDPRALGSRDSLSVSRAELFYARGDERIPIALDRDSGDRAVTRASPKVLVRGLPEERAILEEAAYLALSGATPPQVCRNLALTLEWARRHFTAYQQDIRRLIHDQIGLSPESFILIAWHLIAGLRGESPGGQPNLRPEDQTADCLPWSLTQHRMCAVTGADLLARRETFRRLYIGAFTLRDTLLDRARLDTALAAFDPTDALTRLVDLPLNSLRTMPFRVRPTGERLYDLLAVLHRYATALQNLDIAAQLQKDREELAEWERRIAAHEHADQTLLRQRLSDLRWRCGDLGIVWREGWDEALELLAGVTREDITDLSATMREVIDAAGAVRDDDIWGYLAFRHCFRPLQQHPYWAAADVLVTIQDTLLRTARMRYRGDGKVLVGTRPYHELLRTTRAIRQLLRKA